MENPKVYPLIAFAFCSATNDNLNYIYYMWTIYNKKLNNINNNEGIIKLKSLSIAYIFIFFTI